jgi:hypothetical protein
MLNATFPSDQKYTLEQKGQAQVKSYSKAYARAYHDLLRGQVERRMRLAILMVGSVWYTAWVDAGQPDLAAPGTKNVKTGDAERQKMMAEEKLLMEQKMIGREE